MATVLDLDNVWHNDDLSEGHLRMTTAGVGWKPKDGQKAQLVTFPGAEVRSASWIRVARGHQLKLTLKKGERHIFDGISRTEYDKVKKAVEQVTGGTLENKDISVKGWNWGSTDVQANDLAFQIQGRTAFEIPLSVISNSNMAGKNEVALEFAPPAAPPIDYTKSAPLVKAADELIEMRFYVPDVSKKAARKASKARAKAKGKGGEEGDAMDVDKEEGEEDEDEDDSDDEDEDEDEDREDDITAAEAFHNAVTEGADIAESGTDAVVTLSETSVVTPRGRFDIIMQLDHLRLHGKTYDYKVPYKSVHRQYLLPKADGMHHQMVVGLEPPLRQGQTKYPWLVMQWEDVAEDDISVNLEDDVLQDRFKGLVKKTYSDPLFKTCATLFRHLIGKEMTPPSEKFGSAADFSVKSVKCNVKANQGELYFTDKSMLFVTKQPICIDYSDITRAVFSRVTGAMRSFDITIKLSTEIEHNFTSINKDEHRPIQDFLTSRKIKIKEMGEESGMRNLEEMDLGDDSDEDDDDEESSEDGDARGGKDKGKGKVMGKPAARGGEDDSEEDEDFADSDAPSSPGASSDDSDASGGGDGDTESVVSDDFMEELGAKANGGKAKSNGDANKAPAKEKAKANPKPKAATTTKDAPKKKAAAPEKAKKSADKVEDSEDEDDEDFDDAMDVDSGDEEVVATSGGPPKKKRKTE